MCSKKSFSFHFPFNSDKRRKPSDKSCGPQIRAGYGTSTRDVLVVLVVAVWSACLGRSSCCFVLLVLVWVFLHTHHSVGAVAWFGGGLARVGGSGNRIKHGWNSRATHMYGNCSCNTTVEKRVCEQRKRLCEQLKYKRKRPKRVCEQRKHMCEQLKHKWEQPKRMCEQLNTTCEQLKNTCGKIKKHV